jgi:hypothetical protein
MNLFSFLHCAGMGLFLFRPLVSPCAQFRPQQQHECLMIHRPYCVLAQGRLALLLPAPFLITAEAYL